jgi:mannitol/fructose-specific phosphotransferase system IIA component (Ntr-type)/Kef-type K+ transport system membrane component KefB
MPSHPLFTLAIVLMSGMFGGELMSRLKLPRVTGWIITGIGLGALKLDALGLEHLGSFYPLTDFVLGYIAFTVGSHLNISQLRNAGKRLSLLILAEATITPAIVVFAMYGIGGFPIAVSFIFAAIAVAGAPGTTVLVVREAQASGVFVKTLVAAVALIDVVAVTMFVIVDTELSSGAPITGPGFILTAFPYALKSLAIAAAIGFAVALSVIVLVRTIFGHKLIGATMVTSIIIAWGIAEQLDVSSILACTFVGVTLGNLIHDQERAGEAYVNNFGDILFTAFYTLAGIRLDFGSVIPLAGMVALFFGARVVGKVISTYVSMSLAGAVVSVRKYLGIALIPHGGVAVGIMLFTQSEPMLAEHADVILSVGLAALAVNQLIGPSATRLALGKAGEIGRDRPRLLDFLREQDIMVNFKADTKEEAIRKLTDVLYRTHSIEMDKAEFVDAVLKREADVSTCLGRGFMIPHGAVTDPDAPIVGVMGVSAMGLDFDTPDGKPVQAIVLLATSHQDRPRHLEVLAAFSRALHDRSTAEQLYTANSAAHVYEMIHSSDAEDFNYFIDEMADED